MGYRIERVHIFFGVREDIPGGMWSVCPCLLGLRIVSNVPIFLMKIKQIGMEILDIFLAEDTKNCLLEVLDLPLESLLPKVWNTKMFCLLYMAIL